MIAQPSRIIGRLALTITMLAMVACGSTASLTEPGPRMTVGDRAAAAALDQLGVPYRYGGSGPRGFDCSGLVQYAYARAGISVPRTTGQLWSAARTIRRGDLRAGDLLFFRIDGKMSHVGLYLGGGRFIHAPQSGRTVSVTSLDTPFYRAALIRTGRPY